MSFRTRPPQIVTTAATRPPQRQGLPPSPARPARPELTTSHADSFDAADHMVARGNEDGRLGGCICVTHAQRPALANPNDERRPSPSSSTHSLASSDASELRFTRCEDDWVEVEAKDAGTEIMRVTSAYGPLLEPDAQWPMWRARFRVVTVRSAAGDQVTVPEADRLRLELTLAGAKYPHRQLMQRQAEDGSPRLQTWIAVVPVVRSPSFAPA